MIGKTISHYHILDKLGEGGMGVVYRAEDIKLKRTVALKFLPHHLLANEEDKTRFLHEAQSASALNHPNIMTIYEIDEVDEQTFISMEYIEGETIKDKVEKGPLKTKELLKIAIAVVEGLNAAHKKEIIHRDIKSENIMISKDGMVKIMDFGLAKRKGMSRITKVGSTLGTLAYMSPEQAEGLDVDRRSDLFSFGVVMYEMATGQLPFKGEHDAAILYSIVNEAPLPVRTLNPNVPQELGRIIHKALEKDVEDRYPDIKAMIEELKAASIRGITIPKQEKSIVVLPFVNMSPDPDQEYFSDGLTEEIITDLSQIHDLLVISRSSAMTFKGTKKKIKEIAREVNVQYVLEGSVRKAGNNLRITAQLIDATTDAHLWAEKYSGTLYDVFDIQERVSRSIVHALKLKLSLDERKKIAEHPIENVQAYECYLKANMEIFKFTEGSINRAIQYLHDASEIIGDNPLLYSSMAWAYWNLVNIGVKQEDYLVKAEEYVKKALAMDPEFPNAHAIFGFIRLFRGNQQETVYYFKRALAVNPVESFAMAGILVVYQIAGKISAAVPFCERLIQIDPLDFSTNWLQGGQHFYDGQYNLALQEWRRLYENYPENPYCQFSYALVLAYNNQIDKAFSIIDQNAKANPDNVLAKLGLMLKYALQGDKEKAFQEMTPDFQKTCQRDATYSHHLAGIFALLDAKKESLDWLENAINHGFINYPLLSERDPFLENIRSEERFKKLIERVKNEWESFEV